MKENKAEKFLFVLIVILTVLLFFVGIAILVGTIFLYQIINHTFNSIITILFIIFGVITGFCIFGLFCIRRKPFACMLYIIALGITSIAFITLGGVMFLGKEMFIKALIASLKDSEEAIKKIQQKIDENLDVAKIVLLSVPAVPVLLLVFTAIYRKRCKKFNDELKDCDPLLPMSRSESNASKTRKR